MRRESLFVAFLVALFLVSSTAASVEPGKVKKGLFLTRYVDVELIDDASRYSVLQGSVADRRIYTPEVFYEGHMPMVVKYGGWLAPDSQESFITSYFGAVVGDSRRLEKLSYWVLVKESNEWVWRNVSEIDDAFFQKGAEYFIDIQGDFKRGAGYFAVDVVPSFKISDKRFDIKEYAWWNQFVYNYKSEMYVNEHYQSTIPYVANSSCIYLGNATCQVMWVSTENQSYIYYNNNTHYAITDSLEANQRGMFNESALMASYGNIWDALEDVLSRYGLNNDVLDSTSNNNDLAATNAVYTSDGRFAGAYTFDGDGDYLKGTTFLDSGMTSGTISLWFKPAITYDSSLAADVRIMTKGSQLDFRIKASSGCIGAYHAGAAGWASEIITTDCTWTAGTWYYIAYSFGATGRNLSVNGVVQSTSTDTREIKADSSYDYTVAANYDQSTSYYNGTIDELRFFTDAHTSAEFLAEYNSGNTSTLGPEIEHTDMPPAVTLSSPASGTNATNPVTFSYTPTDDKGFSKAELYINTTTSLFSFTSNCTEPLSLAAEARAEWWTFVNDTFAYVFYYNSTDSNIWYGTGSSDDLCGMTPIGKAIDKGALIYLSQPYVTYSNVTGAWLMYVEALPAASTERIYVYNTTPAQFPEGWTFAKDLFDLTSDKEKQPAGAIEGNTLYLYYMRVISSTNFTLEVANISLEDPYSATRVNEVMEAGQISWADGTLWEPRPVVQYINNISYFKKNAGGLYDYFFEVDYVTSPEQSIMSRSNASTPTERWADTDVNISIPGYDIHGVIYCTDFGSGPLCYADNRNESNPSEIWGRWIHETTTYAEGWSAIAENATSITNNSVNTITYDFSVNYTVPHSMKWNILLTDNYSQTSFASANWTVTAVEPEEDAAPVLSYTAPTLSNGSYTGYDWAETNVSITEVNLNIFNYSWNGANYSLYDDSLVLSMSFNNQTEIGENDTLAVDVSQYGNNGTLTNGATWTSSGKYGNALEFDGSDDFIDTTQNLILTDNVSVFGWAKFAGWDATPSISFVGMVGDGESLATNIPYLLRFDANSVFYLSERGEGENIGCTYDHTGAWDWVLGEWYFLGFTKEVYGDLNVTVKIYENGSLAKTCNDLSNTNGTYTSVENLRIGKQTYFDYFNGTIDEVKIWNRSLSADEIAFLYQSTLYKYNSTDWQFYNNISGQSDGTYDHYGYAEDASSNSAASAIRTITLDTTDPVVSISSPASNGLWYNLAPGITASCTDTNFANMTINHTSYTATKTSTPSTWNNISDIPQGENSLRINCTDLVGNVGNADRSFNFDSIAPASITYVSPTEPDTSNKSQNWYYVNVTFTETNPDACLLNVGGANYSMYISGTNCYLNRTGQSDAAYTYLVYANDSAGNVGESASRSITLDTALPYVQIVLPENTTYSSSTRDLNYTATDTNLAVVWYNYNGTNTTLAGNTTFTATEGQSTITLFANDSAGNANITEVTFTVDTTAPTSNSPSDASYAINASATIGWYLYDNVAPGHYEVYRNGSIQNTTTAWVNNTNLGISVNTSTAGTWNYTITFNDSIGNAGNPDTVIIAVNASDETAPTITIQSPENTTYTSTSIYFNITLDEAGSWAGYSLDGGANNTLTNSTGKWWASNSSMAEGYHTVVFYANDTVGNTGNSSTISFTVSIPNETLYKLLIHNNSNCYDGMPFVLNSTGLYIDGPTRQVMWITGCVTKWLHYINYTSYSVWDYTETTQQNMTNETALVPSYNNLFDGMPGLVARYDLNNNGLDSTSHGHNLTATGASYAEGRFGGAYSLDGSGGYVNGSVLDGGLINGTFTMWFKPAITYDSSLASDVRLMTKGNQLDIKIKSGTGKIEGTHSNGTWLGVISTTTSNWTAGTWYYIAYSFGLGGRNISVNGVVQNTSTGTEPIQADGSYTFTLGANYDQSANYFNGTLDEIRLYNRSLSSSEIIAEYESWNMSYLSESGTVVVLNVSVYNNVTGAAISSWTIDITNGTSTYSASGQSNPAVFYNSSGFPLGDCNITISDGSSVLYFFNSTYSGSVNSTSAWQLNASLHPKSENPVSLSSSLGWNALQGQSTTITCTASETTPDFRINSISVSSPYVLSTQTGMYDVTCNVYSETENYAPANLSKTLLVNPLISCTNNLTFAFQKTVTTTTNITTLDFTEAVGQSLVRENLGDVYISTANDTWINTTGGYYVIVNNTGQSSFTVQFGNSFVNNTYSTAGRQGDEVNMTSYTQINPYALYNVMDELTGTYLFPPNATLTSIIQCSQGETYFQVENDDTKFVIAAQDYITKATLRVAYSADAYYSRQYYPDEADVLVLNFYVADAFVTALDRIDFIMLDMNYYDTKLQLYKTVQNQTVVVTEGYFDAAHSFSAYLIEDIDYYMQVVSASGSTTDFGRITIVAPATKYLGDVTMSLNPQATLIADYIFMNAWNNTDRTSLYVQYRDDLNQTNDLNITVSFENGTVFQSANYIDTNSVLLEYNISGWDNESFVIEFSLDHDTFGNSPVQYSMVLYSAQSPNWGFGASSTVRSLISLTLLVLVGGIASRKSLIAGSAMVYITLIMLREIGWLSISVLNMAFLGVLLALGIIVYVKKSGD